MIRAAGSHVRELKARQCWFGERRFRGYTEKCNVCCDLPWELTAELWPGGLLSQQTCSAVWPTCRDGHLEAGWHVATLRDGQMLFKSCYVNSQKAWSLPYRNWTPLSGLEALCTCGTLGSQPFCKMAEWCYYGTSQIHVVSQYSFFTEHWAFPHISWSIFFPLQREGASLQGSSIISACLER